MKVRVRFLDGEILDGNSDAASLERMGFPMSFPDGNNQIAWVSLASIKYVLVTGQLYEEGPEDPRAHQGLVKVVLHFVDGETMRSYKDDIFSQDGEGFNMRVWDAERGGLLRVLVSLHALKAVFFVNEWDSRTEQEKLTYLAPGEQPVTPAPAAVQHQPAVDPVPEPRQVAEPVPAAAEPPVPTA